MRASSSHELEFGSRFTIRREIGRGGMGIVYAAHDRERGFEVALKRLRELEPTSLYRFKREFRALADVIHPNLVTLYELLCDRDQWFFTMELVEGVDFVDYVRGDDPAPQVRARRQDATTRVTGNTPSRDATGEGRAIPVASTFDPERLRSSFRQLADGLCALHRSGHLHRDIKPSNVLVTPAGRVVILDFGVIAELRGRGYEPAEAVGTPLYMAPEQVVPGASLSEATDWYGAGVVLYQALTGRRPFEGDATEVLRAKQEREPLPPRARVPDVPPDLDELCAGLLLTRADQRPSGAEVLARLSGNAPQSPASIARTPALIGRDVHRDVLHDGFAAAKTGHGQILLVHGRSGIGKSELVHRFLAELEAAGALVLSGRCFERESVPFKGVDSLIDSLASHLLRLPRAVADTLIPRDVGALGRLLPVLRRVDAIAEGRPRSSSAADPHELRRSAFRALRELLARLAKRQPTVLFIDDLQWGDADSGALLADIMHPPDTPPLLVIGAYRTDEAARSPLLRVLCRREERLGPASRLRELAVGPLGPGDARTLALDLLGRATSGTALADHVVREAEGSPYFIHELVHFVQSTPDVELGSLHLQDVVHARIGRLPEGARRLLEIVAVAGRPISQGAARGAVGDAIAGGLELLRGHRLVRTHGARGRDLVEPYHDRIRESVVDALTPDLLRESHHRLATSLETAGEGDAETLGEHWEGAGDPDRATDYYARAAAAAAESLAFDRAADLYARVLELRPESEADTAALLTKLGDALANAGRGPAAAEAYRRAAAGSRGDEALVLRARAATELLRSGHMDEGLDELTPALAEVGLRLARGPWRGLLSLLVRRAHIRLRGLHYRERDIGSIAPIQLAHIDVCWGAACGLAFVDLIRGADVQTRHLLWALRAGQPFRIGRALICEVGYNAVDGPRAEPRVARILAALEDAARRTGEPALRGYLQAGRGLAAYQFCRWQAARELGDEAERIFREQCAGAWWELTTTRLYLLWSLFYLGETAELARRVPAFLADAEAHGDRLFIASLSTGLPHQSWLVRDDPDEGDRAARAAMQAWSHRSYFLQHFWYGFAETQSHIYRGDGAAAVARIQRDWPALRRSMLLNIALIRVEALHVRGRAALAAARVGSAPDRVRLLRLARRDGLRMARIPTPLGPALAGLQLAGVDALRGDPEGAAARLRRGIDGCRRAGLELHRAAAQWQLGRLLGGDEGRQLVEEAGTWMRAQEIADPARMCDVLAPGIAG